MKRDSLTKSIFLYASSNLYKRVCGLINTFIKPKLLSPESYGLWSFLSIVLTYATYAHLGARDIMHFAVPQHQARGEHASVEAVKSVVFYGTLTIAGAISTGVLGLALVGGWDLPTRLGLLAVAALVLLQFYQDYTVSFLKSFQNFRSISMFNLIKPTSAVKMESFFIKAIISNLSSA